MKTASSYLKMRVLGAIESAPGKTQGERIRHVANMVFIDEYGEKRQFTWRTIYTWFYRYKHHGITGVTTASRRDKGMTRKITPEDLMEAINQVKPYFRGKHVNKTAIYRKAIELGILRREQIAPTTFYRFIKEYELLNDESEKPERLAFAMQYANQLWQGDTMFGPYVKNEKDNSIQAKLIALIDDASRVICHGEFFFNENTDALITVLRKAFYKRGIPDHLYFDNGSIYSSKEVTLICARIGTILSHTPVRDGAAKGKIERFFRTVRSSFLTQNLDLSSLAILNQQFIKWVEEHYNHKKHSVLSMKPIDRFALDRSRIRYLPAINANDELFYMEEERTVIATNTFSFRAVTYEAPVLLAGKKVQVRFDRNNPDSPVIVYYKNQRMGEACPLDAIANGLIKKSIKGERQ